MRAQRKVKGRSKSAKRPRNAAKTAKGATRKPMAELMSGGVVSPSSRRFIDGHIHFFNLRYIPVEGLARKRGGLFGPALAALVWLLKASSANDTTLNPVQAAMLPASRAMVGTSTEFAPLVADTQGVVAEFLTQLPDEYFTHPEYEAAISGVSMARSAAAVNEATSLLPAGAAARRAALRRRLEVDAKAWTLATPPQRTDDLGIGIGGVVQFLGNLRDSERGLVAKAIQNQPTVGLFLHLMMDMEAVFEGTATYDYQLAVQRVQKLCQVCSDPATGIAVIPMIAFDPYREAGGQARGLEMVKDAIENRGFVGVKFYPPLGYRPFGNTHHELGLPVDELNKRCQDLFDYCVSGDIPIIAHCTPHGMELRSNDTGLNADPVYWSALFDNPAMKMLRLCLAHTGGATVWNGPRDRPVLSPARPAKPTAEPWSAGVLELCRRFENVYCDLADFSEVVSDGPGRDALGASLVWAINTNANQAPGDFDLKNKLVYGTDFPMPGPPNGWPQFYPSFRDLFESGKYAAVLSPYVNAVFRDNALRFLGLDTYLNRNSGRLPQNQEQAIRDFLKR
jgi:predicted TIM-barrel fold metal-dependent hydrolase